MSNDFTNQDGKTSPKEQGRKSFSSVTEMVREVSADSEFADEFDRQVSRRNIVHHLFGLRSAKEVSQKEMALQMGCSQSRVSKFENSDDDDLRLGDLREYLRALGLDTALMIFREGWGSADRIKFHATMIRHSLERLRELAKDDPQLRERVSDFHIEALYNLVRLVMDSAQHLPDLQQSVPAIFEVNSADCRSQNSDAFDPAIDSIETAVSP